MKSRPLHPRPRGKRRFVKEDVVLRDADSGFITIGGYGSAKFPNDDGSAVIVRNCGPAKIYVNVERE